MANTKYSPVVQELADLIKENSWEDKFAQAFAKVKSYNIPGLSDIDSVEKYLDWLFGFEYGLLGLPEPSLVFYLDVPTELTEKMMREREQATNTKADIHEQDEAYLRACRENAKKVAERCSWQRIGCSKDGAMRTVEDIHEEIYRRVTELLKA